MAKLLKIAKTKDVPPGQAAPFTIEGQKIALFNVEGTYYAVGDTCTWDLRGPVMMRVGDGGGQMQHAGFEQVGFHFVLVDLDTRRKAPPTLF